MNILEFDIYEFEVAIRQSPHYLLNKIDDERLNPTQRVTPLWACCSMGRHELVVQLFALSKELHIAMDVDFRRDEDGVSCLYIAAQNGHLACVRLLMESGHANVDLPRHTRATPLFIAVQENHVEIVNYLLQQGASVDAENDQQCSPLVLACSLGHTAVARALMAYGADICHARTGHTPAQWAARRQHAALCLVLLAARAEAEAAGRAHHARRVALRKWADFCRRRATLRRVLASAREAQRVRQDVWRHWIALCHRRRRERERWRRRNGPFPAIDELLGDDWGKWGNFRFGSLCNSECTPTVSPLPHRTPRQPREELFAGVNDKNPFGDLLNVYRRAMGSIRRECEDRVAVRTNCEGKHNTT